jgi:hypothetical protein
MLFLQPGLVMTITKLRQQRLFVSLCVEKVTKWLFNWLNHLAQCLSRSLQIFIRSLARLSCKDQVQAVSRHNKSASGSRC